MNSERRQQVEDAVMRLASRQDYKTIVRYEIAHEAKVSDGLVTFYLGNADGIRDFIMAEAIRRRSLSIIALGLVDRHPIAMGVSNELKLAALDTLHVLR